MTEKAAAQTPVEWFKRQRNERDLRQYVVYVAFVLILVVFAILLRDDGFLSTSNLLNVARQAAPTAVMAVGMVFALAAAEIDLSVGSTVALSSLVAATTVDDWGVIGAVSAALLTGLLIGLVNGLITVKIRIPSFLVTLGMLGVISGIARNMSGMQSVPIRDDLFSAIFGAGTIGPISTLIVWTVVVAAAGHFALHRLRWGRHILSVGSDRGASKAVGINTDRIRIEALMVSATAAAFAGVLLAGRLGIGRHDLGENNLLTVIAAVVIGGTSLFGGRASVSGAVVGAVIMSMLNNGLILMGLDTADQMIARGIIIIVAVALSMREPKEA